MRGPFKTWQECSINRDMLTDAKTWPKIKKKTKQTWCKGCCRWCYETERCNLYEGWPKAAP